MSCRRCYSQAINHHLHGRDGSLPELCDVCFWRHQASLSASREDDLDATLRTRQASIDRLREALHAIAFIRDAAATPLESAHTMQKLACYALAADSAIELTALSQNLNDARSASSA